MKLFKTGLYLGGIKFICEAYNQRSQKEWEEFANLMIKDYSSMNGRILSETIPRSVLIMGIVISQIGISIKQIKRHEFRRYNPYDLNRFCKGRFELLAFIAVHQGSKLFFNDYKRNPDRLRKDLKIIYNLIEQLAPNAITLDFESFVDEAILSLNDVHMK